MAISAALPYQAIIETDVTIGAVGANTTVTATATVAGQIDTNSVVVATTAEVIQDGLSIGHAWVSAVAAAGSTISFKVINATAGILTPTNDPVTMKFIIL